MVLEKFAKTLRQNGQSLTRSRKLIFDLLSKKHPLLMSQLIKALKGQVDRASIYRAIELFERLGIVIRLQQGFKYRLELSDLFLPHHHHLTCAKCSLVLEFNEPAGFDDIIAKITSGYNFTAKRHQLEIEGLCPGCQKADVV